MAAPVAKEKPGLQKRAARRKHPAAKSGWALRPAGSLQVLETLALAQLDWLTHGFSTRTGGTSEFETVRDRSKLAEKILNLGFTNWDSRKRVLENRKKFFRGIGAGRMRVVTLRQIHSDIVHRVDYPETALLDESRKGDALITRARGVLLVVQTADCIPILLADTKRRTVAAIHSGWRGTVRRIAEKTLGRMQMEFGSKPEDVIAALGPGIAGCCYQVGSDVAKEFHSQFSEAREWFDGPFDSLAAGDNDPEWLSWLTMMPPGHRSPAPRVQLDLVAANRAILAAAGVPPDRILSSGFCTACRVDLFFSYRRERATGRLMAAIGIR
jgi:purine-nucleoside/S-methyl-5'-thioadenosine phosphorylase / adenosine deaminase